jgi:signal peptidase I
MSNTDSEVPKPRRQTSSFEFAKTILFALLIAGGIRTAAAQPFSIPSESMQGTLLVGDYLFVSKPAYGYSRYSMPFGYALPLPHGRLFGSEPKRGDVIVFKTPADNKTDYIKRLIGLPGDRIQMKDGVLYINDEPVPKVPVEPFVEDLYGDRHEVAQYRETLPNGVTYDVLDREPHGYYDTTEMFVVPENHYFMMGDNRDNSQDSRYWGFLPRSYVKGKALVVYWSYESDRDEMQDASLLGRIKGLVSVAVHFFTNTRWSRMLHQIR